jgi:hypothetical protein
MIVRVLTTCHTQYTWDRSICIFLFHRTTIQVFFTYLIGAVYVHRLWFYKHQHDNQVHSKLFVACNNLQFRDTCGKRRNPIERNHMGLHLENEVYCVWQVVKTLTFILNNPVFLALGTPYKASIFLLTPSPELPHLRDTLSITHDNFHEEYLRIRKVLCFTMAKQPPVGHGLLIIEAPRSHSDT